MASSGGRVPEPLFGDALAGSGGMADPVAPAWSVGNVVADSFPDALSVLPPIGPVLRTSSPAGAVARPADLPPVRIATPAPVRPTAPPAARTGMAPFRAAGPSPVRNATGPGPAPGPPRPWSQFPPPGQPAAQYVPVPTSAHLAPTPGRRPTVGLGYSAGPRPTPATAPGGLVRPPAYLPKNQGAAQLRAALRQARQSSTRAPRTASRPKKGKTSSLWGTLVALLIVLLSSGLGERIISAISNVLQRK